MAPQALNIGLPNGIVAVLIFVIAAALAGPVVAAVQQTMDDAAVVPGLIMAIAVFMRPPQLTAITGAPPHALQPTGHPPRHHRRTKSRRTTNR